jgi:3-oxoacid CoA-transferase
MPILIHLTRAAVPRGIKVTGVVSTSLRWTSSNAAAGAGRSRSDKVYGSAREAVSVVQSGDVLLSGGFGMCGLPNTLINALAERRDSVRNLTGVSNNAGAGSKTVGLGTLLASGQLSKLIASYLGT